MSTLTGVVADPVGAMTQYLLSLSDVTDIVDERVFGSALPPESGDFESSLTVRLSGGQGDIDQPVVGTIRLELRCYGLTEEGAASLYWVVHKALNGQNNLIYNDTRFMSIRVISSGAALYDVTLNRPYIHAFLDCMVQLEKIST